MRGTQIMMLGLAAVLLVAGAVALTTADEGDAVNDIGTFTWYPNLSDENNAYSAVNMHIQDHNDVQSFEHIYVMMGATINITIDRYRPGDEINPSPQHLEASPDDGNHDDIGISISSDGLSATGTIDAYGHYNIRAYITNSHSGNTSFHTVQIICYDAPQYVTDIEWSGDTVYDVGDEIYITATGLPDDVDDPRIRFTVLSGEDCLTDAGFGIVGGPFTATTVAAGTVRLQGEAVDDGGYSETITITINAPDPVNIGIEGPTSIDPGDEFRLVADVTGGNPAHSSHGLVSWSVVSGSEYVTLDPMQINNSIFGTGKAPGTAVFRATVVGDESITADWSITVESFGAVVPTSIQLTGPGNLMVGDTGTVYASVIPTNAPNRGILWSIEGGGNLIEYEDSMTYRGGMLEITAVAAGTVTIVATSTADNAVTATYTLTILSPESDDVRGTLQINSVVQALADMAFGGNTTIAGIVIYAAIVLGIFLLIREPLPVLIISMPVTLILTSLRVLSTDLTILLIIVSVLGLALLARNVWRD